MDRARVQKEVNYLAKRLAREEGERALARQRENVNEHRFCQLSHNATLIKCVMVKHMRGGTVEGMGTKDLEALREDYEEQLCRLWERVEEEQDTDFYLPQSSAAGKEMPAEDEEEEEWEMLDRLREEATRPKQAIDQPQPMMYIPKAATHSHSSSAAAAASAAASAAAAASAVHQNPNSKQAMVTQLMADTNLSPAERQRQIRVVMGKTDQD